MAALTVLTVGALKELLDDYGDHVPVVIEITHGTDLNIVQQFEINDGISVVNGATAAAVIFEVEL